MRLRYLFLFIPLIVYSGVQAQPLQTIFYSNGKKALEGRWTYNPGTYFPIDIKEQLNAPLSENGHLQTIPKNRIWDRLALFTAIRPEGQVTMWNAEGEKTREIEFKNGVANGQYREYARGGWLYEEGTLERGMPKGIWKRYSKKGEVTFSGSYMPYTDGELAKKWEASYRAIVLDKSPDLASKLLLERRPLNPFGDEPDNNGSKDSFMAIQQYTAPFARAENESYKDAKRDGTFTMVAITSDMAVVTEHFKDDKRAGEWTCQTEQKKRPSKLQFGNAGNLEYVTGTDGVQLTIGQAVVAWRRKREQQIQAANEQPQKAASPVPAGGPIFRFVEQMPSFNGDLMAWMKTNLQYPAEAGDSAEGRAAVQFVVRSDGRITDAEVIRTSGSKFLDAEALRLVRSMPLWNPGKQQGRAVDVYYTLPVVFRLR